MHNIVCSYAQSMHSRCQHHNKQKIHTCMLQAIQFTRVGHAAEHPHRALMKEVMAVPWRSSVGARSPWVMVVVVARSNPAGGGMCWRSHAMAIWASR